MRSMIPNVITCLNLLLGFAAIVESGRGNIDTASALILLCVALDMLDGYVARRMNAVSHFGGELDSLADIVSFGAAPALILHARFFVDTGLLGLLISAAPLIAAGLRLARFNTNARSNEFHGLPCPAAALLLLSVSGQSAGEMAATALVAFSVVLMVSEFPYPATFSSKRAAVSMVVIVSATVILLPHPLFVLAFGYACTGLVKFGAQSAKRLVALVRQLARVWASPAAETHPPVNRI